ncbi:hypothetical protein GJ496_003478 [Pomphorhynchus laevis]|nr:hypothetical protein GJ496_003478 [Pomphorhynchus laevis]
MRKRSHIVADCSNNNIVTRRSSIQNQQTGSQMERFTIAEEFQRHSHHQTRRLGQNKPNYSVKNEPIESIVELLPCNKTAISTKSTPNVIGTKSIISGEINLLDGVEGSEIPEFWIMNWEQFLAGKRFPQMKLLPGYTPSDQSCDESGNDHEKDYEDEREDPDYDDDNYTDDDNSVEGFVMRRKNKMLIGDSAAEHVEHISNAELYDDNITSIEISSNIFKNEHSVSSPSLISTMQRQRRSSQTNFCEVCIEQFETEELYRQHLKQHKRSGSKSTRYMDGEKPIKEGYRCNLCNQSFSAGYTLKKHIRVHTREKPFSCDLCNERFSQWGNLRLHIQRHLGINPYRCPYCDKAYIAPSKLEVHIRGHTNERPYPCEICYSTFKSNDDLRKHMMIHANYKPFTCWLCHKSFMQPSKLKQHMKEKHMMDVDISKKDVTDKGVEYEIKILPNQE